MTAPEAGGRIRLDKWLWHARFGKSRSLAADFVAAGHVRVNGRPISRPAQPVGAGDVLTFALGGRVHVLRVLDIGTRRGPAPEARLLYEPLDTPPGESVARSAS